MNRETKDAMSALMDKLPLRAALRWCDPGKLGCACLGCANYSGGLLQAGFTKEEWLEYLKLVSTDLK